MSHLPWSILCKRRLPPPRATIEKQRERKAAMGLTRGAALGPGLSVGIMSSRPALPSRSFVAKRPRVCERCGSSLQ